MLTPGPQFRSYACRGLPSGLSHLQVKLGLSASSFRIVKKSGYLTYVRVRLNIRTTAGDLTNPIAFSALVPNNQKEFHVRQ